MDRARDPGAPGSARGLERAGRHLKPTLALLTLAVLACGKLGTDLDQVVALEIILPDSGRVIVDSIIQPSARALNGRGDSVEAEIFWSSLDTAIIAVLDSTSGATLGKAVGTGRLQARTGALRSNPQTITVQPVPTATDRTFPAPLRTRRFDGQDRDE